MNTYTGSLKYFMKSSNNPTSFQNAKEFGSFKAFIFQETGTQSHFTQIKPYNECVKHHV